MKRRAPAADRPRKALWVTTAIILAAVAGAAFFIARARRPAPLALQSEWKPPPVPALDALPWPRVRPEASSSLQAGLGHLSRALAQYGDGRSAEGDVEFREAITTLKAAGAIVPELGPAHLRFVMSAAAARDFPEAERRAEAWLTTFPQDFEHLFLLGQLRYQMRKWSDSAASLRTAARLRPELADVHRWLAQACSQLGAQDDGVAAVKRSLALVGFPDGNYAEQPLARAVLGNAIVVLHHFQEYELLEQVAAAFRKRFGDEGEAIMAQGISLSNLGRYAEAEPLLLRALVDTANSENVDEVAFELGLCLAKQAKWKDAAKVLQELLERDPGYTKAYYQLSLVAVRLGRAAEAAALAAKAEALSASARELRRERELRAAGQTGRAAAAAATGHLLRGDFERAERALRAPELRMEPHAVFALADLYLDELRSAECEQVLEHAATLVGAGHADVLGRRAKLRLLRGETEAGLTGLAESAAKDASGSVWKLEQAQALLEVGRAKLAEEVLVPLRRGSEDREVSYFLGRAYLEEGRPDDALSMLRSISTADTRWQEWNGPAWLAVAILSAQGDASEAERWLAQAQRASLPRLHATALLLEARGAPEAKAAREELRAFTAAEPDVKALRASIIAVSWASSAKLRMALAQAHARRKEFGEAVRHARLALLASPGSLEALRSLAAWLTEDTEVFERLRVLREILRRAPKDTEAAEEVRRIEKRWLE